MSRKPRVELTSTQIHEIRTNGFSDKYNARQLHLSETCVYHARTGRTYRDHPTPPDIRARRDDRRQPLVGSLKAPPLTESQIAAAMRAWTVTITRKEMSDGNDGVCAGAAAHEKRPSS